MNFLPQIFTLVGNQLSMLIMTINLKKWIEVDWELRAELGYIDTNTLDNSLVTSFLVLCEVADWE